MRLEACPLCKCLDEQKYSQMGTLCAAVEVDGIKVVTLLRHDVAPTVDEVKEAWEIVKSMKGPKGLVGGIDMPGHWALSVTPGEWLAGKSAAHSEDPKSS